eukprot:278381-Chlamydomonas_euryale.AAC.1
MFDATSAWPSEGVPSSGAKAHGSSLQHNKRSACCQCQELRAFAVPFTLVAGPCHSQPPTVLAPRSALRCDSLLSQLLALLLLARVWARIGELLLPISFLLLLLSTVPQFVSYVFLVQRLDSGVASGVSFAQILVPNSASWFAMWLVSLLLAWGLRRKERVRDALLQSGAVWTMHEQVARRLRQQDVDVLQRKVDAMSEQEVCVRTHACVGARAIVFGDRFCETPPVKSQ